MKSKEAFNTVIKSMFQQHKLDIESGFFTHDEATQRVLEGYEGFYEWLTEKTLPKEKKKFNKQKAKTIVTIITMIIIIGAIIALIGYIMR